MTVTKNIIHQVSSHNSLPAFFVPTCEQGLLSEGGQRRRNMRRMMTVMFATPTAEASAMTVCKGSEKHNAYVPFITSKRIPFAIKGFAPCPLHLF